MRVKLDDRDQQRPGFKFSEWELKGIPVRMEIGPRDVEADQVTLAERISGTKEQRPAADAISGMATHLESLQRRLFDDATSFVQQNTHRAGDYDELREGIAAEAGFWQGPWCGDAACEAKVSEETKATIRVLPLETQDPEGPCLVCGQVGKELATWARAY